MVMLEVDEGDNEKFWDAKWIDFVGHGHWSGGCAVDFGAVATLHIPPQKPAYLSDPVIRRPKMNL